MHFIGEERKLYMFGILTFWPNGNKKKKKKPHTTVSEPRTDEKEKPKKKKKNINKRKTRFSNGLMIKLAMLNEILFLVIHKNLKEKKKIKNLIIKWTFRYANKRISLPN